MLEFGLELADALAATLGGSGHDRQAGGEALEFETAIDSQKGIHLTQRVPEDVRVTVAAADQAGDGAIPGGLPTAFVRVRSVGASRSAAP